MKRHMPFFLMIIFLLSGCTLFQPQVAEKITPTPTPVPSPTPQLDPEVQADLDAIANLVKQEPSLPAGQIELKPAFFDDSFATGTLTHTYPEAVANKIWIAAKVDGEWALVHYGSPGVPCDSVDSYDVPAELVQVCISSSGELINR